MASLGIAIAVLVGLLLGLTVPAVIDTATNSQILARTSPTTLDMIVATVIGGLGTVAGPIVGAIVVYVVGQALQDQAQWSTFINGLMILIMIRFAPGGLVGVATQWWRAIRHHLATPVEEPPLVLTQSVAGTDEPERTVR